MEERGRRLTDAFVAALELREHLGEGTDFCTALAGLRFQIGTLEDGYPVWHPSSYSFHGMLKLFVYLEVTGDSYRFVTRHPELADVFGLEKTPDESVLSRAWRNRFDEDVRGYITTSAHLLVREIHNEDLTVPEVRPLEEVKQSSEETPDSVEDSTEFSDKEIYRTTRLAREHGFGSFDSGRAQNATYEDTRFFDLQAFIGMVGCGTPQGAARFKFRRGKEYGPNGDTHLRAVKQFDSESLLKGFQQAIDRLLSVIQSESSFRRPVTVAIDITTIRYFGSVEGMPMVSGTKDSEGRAFKFATLSIVGCNIPLILAVEPVRESPSRDQNPPNQIHHTVRRMLIRTKEHVPIEMVLCDREFDSKAVYQTLSNLDMNYLIPKRVHSAEREAIETMDEDEQKVAVESATVHVDHGSHTMQFLYVPSTKGEGTAVFATNLSVGPKEAETFCRRYSRRWQIESEYKSIKNDFLAKTSSKDYRVRLFYFVFAVLLHNIWRLTDFLLKVGVGGEMDYVPVLTAGECVELVCSALIPPD